MHGFGRPRAVFHNVAARIWQIGDTNAMAVRFVTLADVAEQLSVSVAQVRTLVETGEIPAIQVGGRRQWRVEVTELEAYIERQYSLTRRRVATQSKSAHDDGRLGKD